MNVDLFGNKILCETDGYMVSLNDMERAGNAWRLANGMPAYQLGAFLNSKTLKEYLSAASVVWDKPLESFLKKAGKGKTSRTMGHISVAVLLAEQMSPYFHAQVHKTFIEGKILEFRELGGTEFKDLNAAIDEFLPERDGKDNKGVYIQVAMRLRNKILGTEEPNWGTANTNQTYKRFEHEATLCKLLRLGVVKNYDHLKEIIEQL